MAEYFSSLLAERLGYGIVFDKVCPLALLGLLAEHRLPEEPDHDNDKGKRLRKINESTRLK